MNKKEFNKIFKNYHNFFTYDNSIKNNILLIDRGRPISIFKSVIISLILLKKKNRILLFYLHIRKALGNIQHINLLALLGIYVLEIFFI